MFADIFRGGVTRHAVANDQIGGHACSFQTRWLVDTPTLQYYLLINNHYHYCQENL
jgi:hypothetical protein